MAPVTPSTSKISAEQSAAAAEMGQLTELSLPMACRI